MERKGVSTGVFDLVRLGCRSGWADLNRRPLRPKRSALADCATPRWMKSILPSGLARQASGGLLLSSRALFFVIASAARRSAFQLFLVILNAVKDLSVFLFLRGNNTGGNKSPPAQRGRRREDEKILRFAQNDNVPVRTSRHCKPFHSSSRGAERRLCPSHCGRVWRFHFYHIFGLASKRDDLPFSNQADCHTVLPQTWLGWLNT